MVSRSTPGCQSPDPQAVAGVADVHPDRRPQWKRELGLAYRHLAALLAALDLGPEQVPDLAPDGGDFPLLVPRGFVALMAKGDPADPLLRQVLPLGREREPAAGFILDPVGDGQATRLPGLIQKYRGRALLMAHGACAVHCRYCFRRHFPYADLGATGVRLASAIAAVAADGSLSEVILSGGDPLMLDDQPLSDLLGRLAALPQIRRLRLHSRLPVVLPERITDRLCSDLAGLPVRPVLVIHANHPRELGPGVAAGLRRLGAAGVTLLNQAVLLRGVNDEADTLVELCESLFHLGVLPYYLHQLDPVQGAAHFAVSDRRARRLQALLRARLPGYLVPRLVRELAGEAAKRPLG